MTNGGPPDMSASGANGARAASREGQTARGAAAEIVGDLTRSQARRWFAVLMLCTLGACVFQWHSRTGFEPIDCWVAQTAREMYEAGTFHGYIIPKFSGETRMQKSPGAYWAVCLTAWLRGGVVDEVSVRIPNTFATLLLVASVAWLVRHIAGRRAAIFAGFVTATSGVVLYWSGRGASDLGVTALMTLSLAALWIGSERAASARQRVSLWMLGYFAAGLAMLYKMPMPFVCIGVPVVLYVVLRRRWSILLSPWHLVGLVIFCLPWLPWALTTMQIEPSALHKWKVEYVDRATGELPNVEGQDKWYWSFYYVGIALAFAAPYFISVPGAIWRAMRDRERIDRNGAWFLLLWLAGLFLFFSAAAGKETRYFLPAMPPLLAMLGIELAAMFDPARPAAPRGDRVLSLTTIVLTPLMALAGAAGIYAIRQYGADDGDYSLREMLLAYALTAGLFCATAIAAAVLRERRRENLAFGAMVAGTWATWLAASATMLPLLGSQAPFRDFAVQLRDKLSAEEKATLRQIAQQDSRITWYSDVRYPRVIDQLKLLEMTGGKRNRDQEIEIVGAEMIRRLEGESLALFVATPGDYLMFFIKAPLELAKRGRAMPPTYTWIYANVGRWDHRYIVFGNKPPAWEAPKLEFAEKFEKKLTEVRDEAAELLRGAASRPAE